MSARPSVFTACLQVRDVLPADDAENRLGIAAQQSHTFALGGDRIVSGLSGLNPFRLRGGPALESL